MRNLLKVTLRVGTYTWPHIFAYQQSISLLKRAHAYVHTRTRTHTWANRNEVFGTSSCLLFGSTEQGMAFNPRSRTACGLPDHTLLHGATADYINNNKPRCKSVYQLIGIVPISQGLRRRDATDIRGHVHGKKLTSLNVWITKLYRFVNMKIYWDFIL